MAKASVGLFVSDAPIRGRGCAAGAARDGPWRAEAGLRLFPAFASCQRSSSIVSKRSGFSEDLHEALAGTGRFG
jgi:hypothetical protein